MKIRYSVYIIFIAFLLFVQQIVSGCAMTSSKGRNREEVESNSQLLFQDKCTKCHELPDIGSYPYSPDDWEDIVDDMVDTKEAGQYISLEEAEEIKGCLRKYLKFSNTKFPDIGEE